MTAHTATLLSGQPITPQLIQEFVKSDLGAAVIADLINTLAADTAPTPVGDAQSDSPIWVDPRHKAFVQSALDQMHARYTSLDRDEPMFATYGPLYTGDDKSLTVLLLRGSWLPGQMSGPAWGTPIVGNDINLDDIRAELDRPQPDNYGLLAHTMPALCDALDAHRDRLRSLGDSGVDA